MSEQERGRWLHYPRDGVTVSIYASADADEERLGRLGWFQTGENCLEWCVGEKGLALYLNDPEFLEQRKSDALIDLDCILDCDGTKDLIKKIDEPYLEILDEPESNIYHKKPVVAKVKLRFWLRVKACVSS